ncbi:hypothetical protein [Bosea sp. BK604]|uniref:hypothetical protein n=1 Tax=Bosea sp. BK604 TaxID=2512180 RepID=UPI0010435FC4|nr:hypothetical protein [Bosea sp. BK604]TCR65604.1 hypothetical protein EV560_105367 [Bosea sp. BK604]
MSDNQTQQDWLDLPSVAGNPNAQGTGAYLDQNGVKDYVTDITYDGMLERDRQSNFRAFAWVPHAVATVQQVTQTKCGGRCVKTCKTPGCLCDRSIGQCK